MSSKKALNAKNLEALGAETLADLVMQLVDGSASGKRLARSKLAAASSPKDLAFEVHKRLAAIRKAKTRLKAVKAKALAKDLDANRKFIVQELAVKEPALATPLLFDLINLMQPAYERADKDHHLTPVFDKAVVDLATVLKAADTNPEQAAELLNKILEQNDYAQFHQLIPRTAPALGPLGLGNLRDSLTLKLEQTKDLLRNSKARNKVADWELKLNVQRITSSLADIADALDDVDQYAALTKSQVANSATAALSTAERLLAHSRFQDTLDTMDACKVSLSSVGFDAWFGTYANALEGLGHIEQAQTLRRQRFLDGLNTGLLRTYLKKLPDFEDEIAEDEIIENVLDYQHFGGALHFLINWPDLAKASGLILARSEEINGEHFEFLTAAAERLSENYPLAATLIYRAMIEYAFKTGRSSRYKYTAKHLRTCEGISLFVDDFGMFADHPTYMNFLKVSYDRRLLFWKIFDAASD